MPTQIIAERALEYMELLVHSYRKKFKIAQFCQCLENQKRRKVLEAPSADGGDVNSENEDNQAGPSNLNLFSDGVLSEENKSVELNYSSLSDFANESDIESDSSSDEEGGLTLRDLLVQSKTNWGKNMKQITDPVPKRQRMETVEDIITCVIEQKLASSNTSSVADAIPGKEAIGEPDEVIDVDSAYLTRLDAFKSESRGGMLPPRFMVLADSSKMYPDIPHSWLCNGKLLRLHDSSNKDNSDLFHVT